jgi:alkanesulfonate monooxygenase SsuD/methylene tetrahydromethanopterin reductase-like flavin-dependent oxidoreductase (luciferase family)
VCAETEAEVEDKVRSILERYRPFVTEDRMAGLDRMFRVMAGTPEQLVERLQPWVDAGLGYAIVYFQEAAYDSSGLELFAREVFPAFPR